MSNQGPGFRGQGSGSSVLELRDVVRTFTNAVEPLHVLKGCAFQINTGETVALIGPSGSGKSTLLQITGLLEKPDGGAVIIDGRDTVGLDDMGRTLLRRSTIGFVYQFHHLLPEFSAEENIMLPQMIAGVVREDAKRRADELLALVGLTNRATHRPARLSGGEQQRVALARALANKPKLLIADEPTGNLDPETAENVFAILQTLVQSEKLALFMATHNHELAKRMSRKVQMQGGIIA